MKTKIKTLALLVPTGIIFFPVIRSMAGFWLENPDYSHCWIVPFVSIGIAWANREKWLSLKPSASGAGLVLLIGSLFLLVLSRAAGIDIGGRLALFGAIHGLVLYNGGRKIYRALWFPLFFLLLMIPVPISIHGLISFPLQLLATDMAGGLLKFWSVPVYQSGNILHFPQGALEVVEACSGIRSLLAFTTLGILAAYLYRKKKGLVATLLLSIVPVALAANVIRVAVSGLIGVLYGMKAARGFMHDVSGLALFLFGFAFFLFEVHVVENLSVRARRKEVTTL